MHVDRGPSTVQEYSLRAQFNSVEQAYALCMRPLGH
ncbi:uncharacterized protein METZ01_LOCUS408285 [marine metagenome]|uniref:Uncharacterized protein n=1 Tax=marine metagenome TaxID=408172 RepID=A0A382WBB1_9ZZZZ